MLAKRAAELEYGNRSVTQPPSLALDRFRLRGRVLADQGENPPPLPDLQLRVVDKSGNIVQKPEWRTDAGGRFDLDVSQSELSGGEDFTVELADPQGNRVQSIGAPIQMGEASTIELRIATPAGSLLSAQGGLGRIHADGLVLDQAQFDDQRKQFDTWRRLRMLDLDRRLAASVVALQSIASVQRAIVRQEPGLSTPSNPASPE